MKYIIVEQNSLPGLELPILCNDCFGHNEVVPVGSKVVSAGFVSLGSGPEITCWGESISLKVKSRGEEDSKLVRKSFGLDTGW